MSTYLPLLIKLELHEDPIVADTALHLRIFTTQYNAGALMHDEYMQTCRDLLDMKRVCEMTNDHVRQANIAKVFQQLYDVIKNLGSFAL